MAAFPSTNTRPARLSTLNLPEPGTFPLACLDGGILPFDAFCRGRCCYRTCHQIRDIRFRRQRAKAADLNRPTGIGCRSLVGGIGSFHASTKVAVLHMAKKNPSWIPPPWMSFRRCDRDDFASKLRLSHHRRRSDRCRPSQSDCAAQAASCCPDSMPFSGRRQIR
jgi:hypothetical protein